jgi:hypothetical protein
LRAVGEGGLEDRDFLLWVVMGKVGRKKQAFDKVGLFVGNGMNRGHVDLVG